MSHPASLDIRNLYALNLADVNCHARLTVAKYITARHAHGSEVIVIMQATDFVFHFFFFSFS